jgi:hypothetical protein
MGTEGRFRPFICVGVAYLIVAIIGPILVMYATGIDKGEGLQSGWTFSGIVWSTVAGAVGALGAFTLIMALGIGGPSSPGYVMPIVFGFAPVISTFTTMYMNNLLGKMRANRQARRSSAIGGCEELGEREAGPRGEAVVASRSGEINLSVSTANCAEAASYGPLLAPQLDDVWQLVSGRFMWFRQWSERRQGE